MKEFVMNDGGTEMRKAFGLLQCTVLPDQRNNYPFLLWKNRKTEESLAITCRTCSIKKLTYCTHLDDKDRAFEVGIIT